MSYPNKRDCEHGLLRGKCDKCDDEAEIARLEKRIAELEAGNKAVTQMYSDAVDTMTGLDNRIAELEEELKQALYHLEQQKKGVVALAKVAGRKNQWISVDDRLPTGVSDNYTTYRPNSPQDSRVTSTWYDPCHNGWSGKYKVTHWMPLPEPPKVRGE